MPVVHLRNEGFDVTAFFFNPNIHPEEEYDLRRASAQLAADKLGYPIVLPVKRKTCPVDQGAGWNHYGRRTLYDLLSATPVADGSGSEETGFPVFYDQSAVFEIPAS